MTIEYPAQVRDRRPPSIGQQIGDLIDREPEVLSLRFDRVDRDIADLKTGLAENTERLGHVEGRLDKADQRLDKIEIRLDKIEVRLDKIEVGLGNVEGQLGRLERAFERATARSDANFERLFGLIQRNESGGS